MMMTKKSIVVLLGGLAILTGCREDVLSREWAPRMENLSEREYKVGKPMFVQDMKDDDVIVAVNGEALTKRELDNRLGRYRWFQSRQRTVDAQQKTAMYRNYGRTLPKSFVTAAAVSQAARKAKLLDEATVRREVENSVAMTLKNWNISRSEFDKAVPGGIRGIAESLEQSLWVYAYFTNNVVIDPTIDSNLVAKITAKINAENAVARRSNDVIRARLEEARKRVVEGGEDFGKVTDQISEDDLLERDGTGYYGKFSESNIADENVRKVVFAMKVGDISPIVEEVDGYSVYKVTELRPAEYRGGQKIEEAVVTLCRMFVEKQDLTVLGWGNDPVKDMRDDDFNRKSGKLAAELVRKATVVYPHGTNFWVKTSGKAKANRK